jgi:hypothetical protein
MATMRYAIRWYPVKTIRTVKKHFKQNLERAFWQRLQLSKQEHITTGNFLSKN